MRKRFIGYFIPGDIDLAHSYWFSITSNSIPAGSDTFRSQRSRRRDGLSYDTWDKCTMLCPLAQRAPESRNIRCAREPGSAEGPLQNPPRLADLWSELGLLQRS